MSISAIAIDPRYPIGKFQPQEYISQEERKRYIHEIAALPDWLRASVAGLSDSQLDTPYRQDGWIVRQLIHHLADSHMNSYLRFKLALTEDQPTIKDYDEKLWAELPEARTAPIDISIELIDALHRSWVLMLKAMTPIEWEKTFVHPKRGVMSLEHAAAVYAWHGRHHVAHITELRARMGW